MSDITVQLIFGLCLIVIAVALFLVTNSRVWDIYYDETLKTYPMRRWIEKKRSLAQSRKNFNRIALRVGAVVLGPGGIVIFVPRAVAILLGP